jgi:hypothetical protein
LTDKLKAATGQSPADTEEKSSDGELKGNDEIKVRPGTKPFTYLVTDGKHEHLVTQGDNGVFTCNCKPKCTDCAHVSATQRFAA